MLTERLSRFEAVAVEAVANVAPWLAPLPTAWLVFDRAIRYLGWPWPVALVAGLMLELLGVAILATALELYDYNQGKRESDPPAPLWLAVALVALYLLAAEALTVLLDVLPAAAVAAPALFPVLSGAAFVLLALRANHRRRLDAIEAQKAQRRVERAEARMRRAQPGPQPERTTGSSAQVPAFRYKGEHVRWLREAQPGLTKTQLAELAGCDLSYVGRALRRNGGSEEGK